MFYQGTLVGPKSYCYEIAVGKMRHALLVHPMVQHGSPLQRMTTDRLAFATRPAKRTPKHVLGSGAQKMPRFSLCWIGLRHEQLENLQMGKIVAAKTVGYCGLLTN